MFVTRFTTAGAIVAYTPPSLCFADPEPAVTEGGAAPVVPPPVDAAGDDAPATVPADDPAPAEPPAPAAPAEKPARRGLSLQEKFERASAARRAAEAERDAALARLAELAASRPADPPAPPAPAEPARPDRAAFANPDDYDAAIVEWAAEKAARRVQDATRQSERQRLAEEAERARRQESATESERVNAAFFDRRAKFMAATPDYIEVAEAEDLPISRVMAEAILLDEHGPQIAYWLGENPEEAARIAGMTRGVYQSGQMAGLPAPDAARQLLEIGRIAARITAPSAKAPTAPAPIAPMRAAAAAAVAKSPEDETMEEYASRRLAALSRH